jgi:hypothetical protein
LRAINLAFDATEQSTFKEDRAWYAPAPTLPEEHTKGACIDLVELHLCRFCSGIQSLKKGGKQE